MKEFWYSDIEKYLDKADQYDNPKTVKMYEISEVEGNKKLFKAVVNCRTYIIGFQGVTTDLNKIKELSEKCEKHKHAQGIILEVGKLA